MHAFYGKFLTGSLYLFYPIANYSNENAKIVGKVRFFYGKYKKHSFTDHFCILYLIKREMPASRPFFQVSVKNGR